LEANNNILSTHIMATETKTTAMPADSPLSTGSVSLEPTEKTIEPPAPEVTSPVVQSLVLAHLQSYPTVNAAYNYAASFPLVQRISSKALPIFEAVREKSRPISDPIIKRASPILERADKLGDDILTRVDDKIPQLKTTEPQEVIDIARRPVDTVISTAEAYSTAARDRFTVRIVKPIQDATENVKVQYASVYDSKGKPLIKTRVDPLLLPLNEKFEALINLYLPKGENDVSKYENELARTVHLAIAAIKRARPVIDEKATQLKALPKETRAHVQEVYEKQRGEYSNKSPVSSTIYASLATWKQISSEGVTYAGSVLHREPAPAEKS
jgi:sporulation-specific protein 4